MSNTPYVTLEEIKKSQSDRTIFYVDIEKNGEYKYMAKEEILKIFTNKKQEVKI